MSTDPFPELNTSEWDAAHENAASYGTKGLTKAMHLMTVGIANARSQIGSHLSYLKKEINTLNSRLDEFNKSSESLTKKAIGLTRWIMIAAVVSATATVILAIDIVIRWLKF